MIAALYVDGKGVYSGRPDVDCWPIERDARDYVGPWPVVAHPECKRWGRFWHGSPRKPHQFNLGDDGGQFACALTSVRFWGGVIEHPEASHAWRRFGLKAPPRNGGWIEADQHDGFTCCVEQGFYGHVSRKPTWLYSCRTMLPVLRWGQGAQRLDPAVIERFGYVKARRNGVIAMMGGKLKEQHRQATPLEFAELLLSIARSAR